MDELAASGKEGVGDGQKTIFTDQDGYDVIHASSNSLDEVDVGAAFVAIADAVQLIASDVGTNGSVLSLLCFVPIFCFVLPFWHRESVNLDCPVVSNKHDDAVHSYLHSSIPIRMESGNN